MQILAKKCWHMHLTGMYHVYVSALSFSLSCLTIYRAVYALRWLRLLVQYLVLKRAVSRFEVTLNFSFSVFVIHVNLFHPEPSFFSSWFIIISLVFFHLVNHNFQVPFNSKLICTWSKGHVRNISFVCILSSGTISVYLHMARQVQESPIQ